MADEQRPEPVHNHGRIDQVDLQLEMQRSYLDYAMSVIVGRALPDVRDGLKPVHRRVGNREEKKHAIKKGWNSHKENQ